MVPREKTSLQPTTKVVKRKSMKLPEVDTKKSTFRGHLHQSYLLICSFHYLMTLTSFPSASVEQFLPSQPFNIQSRPKVGLHLEGMHFTFFKCIIIFYIYMYSLQSYLFNAVYVHFQNIERDIEYWFEIIVWKNQI